MNRFYNTLAVIAVILTPVAMMTTAGWNAYAATLAQTSVAWLAVVAGIATATALECVGILAGELALWFHGRNDRRWRTAALVLAIYVAAGVYVLWGTALIFLPILAGSVYVLVGLRAQAARETAAENGHEAANAEWEREQWRVRQADKTRLKLAEIETKVGNETRATPKAAESATKLSGKQAEIHRALQEKPSATYTEIGLEVGVSRQFVGQVARRLNGHGEG